MISGQKIGRLAGLVAAAWLAFSSPAAATAHAQTAPKPEARAELAAPRPDGRTTPRPAIWLLADEDTRIYLFGTIHMLRPGLHWRSQAFENVVAEADELVLEVAEDPDETQFAAIAPLFLRRDRLPLADRVSPGRREGLRDMIRSLGLQAEAFEGMQTWAAAMTIAVTGLTQALAGPDGSPEAITGVEDELRTDFRQSGRPISGVEDARQQLGFLSGLSAETQREMLEEMIDSYAEGDPDLTAPDEEGWLRGDTDEIATEMEEMPAELIDVLLTRRNTAWTGWLIARLERPGTVLFAVGAGHLAGRHSVQSMLAERGFTVTRLH